MRSLGDCSSKFDKGITFAGEEAKDEGDQKSCTKREILLIIQQYFLALRRGLEIAMVSQTLSGQIFQARDFQGQKTGQNLRVNFPVGTTSQFQQKGRMSGKSAYAPVSRRAEVRMAAGNTA